MTSIMSNIGSGGIFPKLGNYQSKNSPKDNHLKNILQEKDAILPFSWVEMTSSSL